MLERRHIRVLVPYSRTLYYNDKGRERGITAETARAFEQYLNKKYAAQLGKRPITLYLVPTTRDELLEDVAQGAGRHRRRQPDCDRWTPADSSISSRRRDAKPNREIVLSGAKAGAGGHGRGAVGQDRARALDLELPRQPGGAEPAPGQGRQAGDQAGARCPTSWKTRT